MPTITTTVQFTDADRGTLKAAIAGKTAEQALAKVRTLLKEALAPVDALLRDLDRLNAEQITELTQALHRRREILTTLPGDSAQDAIAAVDAGIDILTETRTMLDTAQDPPR